MKVLAVIFVLLILWISHRPIQANAKVTKADVSYNILVIFPTVYKSHFKAITNVLRGLSERGHNLTIISPFKLTGKSKILNANEVLIDGMGEAIQAEMSEIPEIRMFSYITTWINLHRIGMAMSHHLLKHPEVKKLLKKRRTTHYDVVLLDVFANDAMLGIANHFRAPVVAFATFGVSKWTNDMIGQPTPLSYVPNALTSFGNDMSLWQRYTNIALFIFESFYTDWLHLPVQSVFYEETFLYKKPTLLELRRNVSAVLLNTHYTVTGIIRPYLPNMIEVGGLHIRKERNALPRDLQDILDNSQRDVLYFSLGSNLPSSELPLNVIAALVYTFNRLPFLVLFKWEMEEQLQFPDNVITRSWFPQQAVLGHPKVKYFITHGGMLSLTEAVYFAVPIIGIPVYGDQFSNVESAVRNGFAVHLDLYNITRESFEWACYELIRNPKYTKRVYEMQSLFRHKTIVPIQAAIFWIEYVARHRGAPHMRSPGHNMNFMFYYNLDLILMPFILLLIIFPFRTFLKKYTFAMYKYLIEVMFSIELHPQVNYEEQESIIEEPSETEEQPVIVLSPEQQRHQQQRRVAAAAIAATKGHGRRRRAIR